MVYGGIWYVKKACMYAPLFRLDSGIITQTAHGGCHGISTPTLYSGVVKGRETSSCPGLIASLFGSYVCTDSCLRDICHPRGRDMPGIMHTTGLMHHLQANA